MWGLVGGWGLSSSFGLGSRVAQEEASPARLEIGPLGTPDVVWGQALRRCAPPQWSHTTLEQAEAAHGQSEIR